MQIFVTDKCPVKSAKNLDDKRVIKMILESAQLLSNQLPADERPYKLTHVNHPCNVWLKNNNENQWWLLRHFKALLSEYEMRYNKNHKCKNLISVFDRHIKSTDKEPVEFINCTNYKDVKCVFVAYMLCLNDKWAADIREPTWYKISF